MTLTVLKLALTVCIILVCVQIGKKYPSTAGLIATMPLTGLIVLVWLWTEEPGGKSNIAKYAEGALWGIAPSILFYAAALFCIRKNIPFGIAIAASFAVWLIGALIHQKLLK